MGVAINSVSPQFMDTHNIYQADKLLIFNIFFTNIFMAVADVIEMTQSSFIMYKAFTTG